ncbi:peptidase M23 [Bacteroidia bacterium]|nr:peptidase M23 [Bacteroidia bacterium]
MTLQNVKYSIGILMLLSVINGFGQFNGRSPLDIPLELSGSYGELRGSHFHAGMDFKTQQREGFPVYAIADGEVVRLLVSTTSYGKAIYFRTTQGVMSVYGHLSQFVEPLASAVKQYQYAKKSFEIDLTPQRPYTFKKGDLLGYSGNTGSSGGPHLHFEMRNSAGDQAINPGLFGYAVKDNIPPTLSTLAVYPNNFNLFPLKQDLSIHIPVIQNGNRYSISPDTLNIYGRYAFGIDATDKANGQPNVLGLYNMQVLIDDMPVFYWQLDSVGFGETSDINSFIDYAHYDSTRQRIQWTVVYPNNRLNVYKYNQNSGFFDFTTEGVYKVQIKVADFYANTSTLSFYVNAQPAQTIRKIEGYAPPRDTKLFEYQKENSFSSEGIQITLPKNALYQTIDFAYSRKLPDSSHWFSDVHQVHHSGTPLCKSYTLKIRPKKLAPELLSKALIASVNKDGTLNAEGGSYKDGFVSIKIKKFCTFVVCIDTIKPKIMPLNIVRNRVSMTQDTLKFQISDDFSGIARDGYEAKIDGHWFLMEYDPKIKYLWGAVDTTLPKGKHRFELTVKDQKGNSSYYNATIER